ncbi:MAG: DUF3467 domain-containing protein [Syntrophales bacterium]|jgi:hypothetical protein
MADQPNVPQQQLQINTIDEMSRGRYANSMIVTHSPEEFIMDWLINTPNGTHLVSRIITSPGHIKRIIDALTVNLNIYEKNFGTIKIAEPGDHKFH